MNYNNRSPYSKSPLRRQVQHSPLLPPQQQIKQTQNQHQQQPEKIKLIIRIRPILEQQMEDNEEFITLINSNSLKINRPGSTLIMKFSDILNHMGEQEDLYEKVRSNIDSFFQGINSAIFAYGQTGSGKTFSILGELDDQFIDTQALQYLIGERRGILPRTLQQIIEEINPDDYSLFISFYEVYNEKIYDLFSEDSFYKDELEVRENKNGEVNVQDLKIIEVLSLEQAMETLSIGLQNRITGSTQANKQSSRSHSIFQIKLFKKSAGQFISSMKIVDLAGSEKYKIPKYLSQEEKEIRLQELTSINGSLSALGNCIQALTDKNRKHIPFRNSKLTRVLSDCLSGEGKITFIICVSPSVSSSQETLSTLQFADRAKKVVLDGRNLQNVYRQYQEQQMKKLEQDMLVQQQQNMVSIEQYLELQNMYNHEKSQRQELEGMLEKLLTQQQFSQLKSQMNYAINESPMKQSSTITDINRQLMEQNQYLLNQVETLQDQIKQIQSSSQNEKGDVDQVQLPQFQQNQFVQQQNGLESQYNTNKFTCNFWELDSHQNQNLQNLQQNIVNALNNQCKSSHQKQEVREKQEEIQKKLQLFLEESNKKQQFQSSCSSKLIEDNINQQTQYQISNSQQQQQQQRFQSHERQIIQKQTFGNSLQEGQDYQQNEDSFKNYSYQNNYHNSSQQNNDYFTQESHIEKQQISTTTNASSHNNSKMKSNYDLQNGHSQQQQILLQQQQQNQQKLYSDNSSINDSNNLPSHNHTNEDLWNKENEANYSQKIYFQNQNGQIKQNSFQQQQQHQQQQNGIQEQNKELGQNFESIIEKVNVKSSNINNIVSDLKLEMNKAMSQLYELQREDDELDTQSQASYK